MSNTDQFDWVDFYKEFAETLLQFRNDRAELVENVKKIYEITGLQMPTLEKGNQLMDIDPFTVFGLFNKNSMKKENRIQILSAIAQIFNISAPVPTSFDSIPVLNNLNSVFYRFVGNRDKNDIDDLWKLFSAALAYTSEPSAENQTKLSKYFDLTINKKRNGTSKITMGMYWIAPDTFLNLDQRNTWYIYESGKIPEEFVQTLPKIGTKLSAEKYFDIVEKMQAFLQSDKSNFKDFKELSFEAWRYSKQVNEEERAKEEENKTEWFPTIDEYDPGLSVDDWYSLLNDPEIFDDNSLFVVKAFLDIGGQATCKQLAEEYGHDPGFYNIISTKLAKRIHAKTNCPIIPRDSHNSRWWPILYFGKKANGEVSGNYIWRLRDELSTALSMPIDEKAKNTPVIWKISHGTPQTSGITVEMRKIFEDKKIVVVNQITGSAGGSNITQGYAYMNEIKKGDYFFLCYAGEIVLLGQFTENKAKLNKERGTDRNDHDWYERSYRLISRSAIHEKYTGKKKVWTSNYNSTCVKVTDNVLFEELILEPYFGLKISDLEKAEFYPTYTKSDFLSEVFLTEHEYDKLRSLILRKKNIILQGAPGVGKTFSAKRLAYSIIGEKNENRICMVQFHQNYSYEDFIMGYRPNDSGGFELQSGVFFNFCERCKENPDKPYFFIIDEINRGNLSKIFGELLMLIEADKRGEEYKINLVYGGTAFYIPENLYIIGMMNTADRSLAMIDYALRRRFSFYTMKPAFENTEQNGFGEYMKKINCESYHTIIAKIKELNEYIRNDSTLGKGFEIGHSYFVPMDINVINDDWVRDVVEYEIIPLIEEYWFDDDKKVDEWTKALYQVIGDQNDR